MDTNSFCTWERKLFHAPTSGACLNWPFDSSTRLKQLSQSPHSSTRRWLWGVRWESCFPSVETASVLNLMWAIEIKNWTGLRVAHGSRYWSLGGGGSCKNLTYLLVLEIEQDVSWGKSTTVHLAIIKHLAYVGIFPDWPPFSALPYLGCSCCFGQHPHHLSCTRGGRDLGEMGNGSREHSVADGE